MTSLFRSFLVLSILSESIIAVLLNGEPVVGMAAVLRRKRNQSAMRDYAGFDYVSIPKTMSTLTKLVLCDLVRRQRRLERQELTIGDGNVCVDEKWFDGVPPENGYAWESPKNRTTLFILRDPLERFVSMYSYLCHQNKFCGEMDIHEFSERAYHSLINHEVDEVFDEPKEVYRDLQPSFWYVYQLKNTLPSHPTFMYMTLNRRRNARRMSRIFINKGNVPIGVANKVVLKVASGYANTLKTEEGKRDVEMLEYWENEVHSRKSTFLNVLRTYYEDYRLLKFYLRKPVLLSIEKYGVELPDGLEMIGNKHWVLADRCGVPTFRTEDYTNVPRSVC